MSIQINLVQRGLDIRGCCISDSTCRRGYVKGSRLQFVKLHTDVVTQTGFCCRRDAVSRKSCVFIGFIRICCHGARSVENQQHRIVASGVGIPAGNQESDRWRSCSHDEFYCGSASRSKICISWLGSTTEGNPLAHAILRGYVDKFNHAHANYHYEDLIIISLYEKSDLKNPACIVDCNHSNSNKQYLGTDSYCQGCYAF